MSRYIDADELLERIPYEHLASRFAVVTAPTADVAPVKHGEWIEKPEMDFLDKRRVMHHYWMCDICGFIHDFVDGHTSQYGYCPNCGAKMDGKKEEKGGKRCTNF